MPDLYDLLACPSCKVAVVRTNDELRCPSCGTAFPIVDGVPIMMAGGTVPDLRHEQVLNTLYDYFPWVHRVVLQSLLDDQVVVEIGSGNRAKNDPAVIRMDVVLTPHVDIVADAHALPFLPGSLDFIFSLAVVEHLRQPFVAAEEMHRALKDGGYVYNECNFVFAYHGYPHHYFNASIQGLQQVFAPFRELRTGIAPYQMPSQALQMVIATYLRDFKHEGIERGLEFAQMLTTILQEELIDFDKGFTEETAAATAAGTFLFGVKQTTPSASCFPPAVMQVWQDDPTLRERFPDPVDLGHADNLLVWAREEGVHEHVGIREHLAALVPFAKHGPEAAHDRTPIRSLPRVEPVFSTIFDYPDIAPARKQRPTPGTAMEPRDDTLPAGAQPGTIDSRPPSRASRLWRLWRTEHTAATIRQVAKKAAARLR
jgi:uncharacterized protein YbaR (Trm112 family)/SAM-dependent methyltransferase